MKRFLLPLLLLPAVLAAAHPVQRVMLLETFTNVSCPNCAAANPMTHQFILDHGPHEALNIQYHVDWPSPVDPFYTVDPPLQTTRRVYYGIGNVPALVAGGTARPVPGDTVALNEALATVQRELSPVRLHVATNRSGNQLAADVTIVAVAPVAATDLRLRAAIVDPHIHYTTPPGNNGETDFYWSVRRMLPDAVGTTIPLAAGDSLVVNLAGTVDAAWDSPDLEVIAWLQDDATGEVLQAAGSQQPAAFAFSYYGARRAKVSPVGVLYRFDSWLENAGSSADTYTVAFTTDVPTGWSVTACSGSTCYPPWVTSFDVALAPGQQELIAMDFTPSGAGTGTATVTVTSQGDPSLSITRRFTLIAAGDEVLYVDADGGQDTDAYFTTALAAAGATQAVWPSAEYGLPRGDDLQHYQTVVWNADLALPALPDDARAALDTLLTGGGNLLLSGQDVVADLCDPASGHSSDATRQWVAERLGVIYMADDANATLVAGSSGDPFYGGLFFAITGGDGTNDQDYPDALGAAANGLVTMIYNSGDAAAVRAVGNGGKILTLGFGFTGIATAAARADLMNRTLSWFRDTTVAAADQTPALAVTGLAAAPNPFNPATEIHFTIGGASGTTVPVTVRIHDATGRLVRELWYGPLATGEHRLLWNGLTGDGRQAASGLYLVRVTGPGTPVILKLTLAK